MNILQKTFLLGIFCLFVSQVHAQQHADSAAKDVITRPQWNAPLYTSAQDYIIRNLKYPEAAIANKIEGTIMIIAFVDTTGQTTDVRLEKDLGYGTGDEAIRVVKSMPAFKPAMHNGQVARMMMKFPVHFALPKQLDADSIRKTDTIFAKIPDNLAEYPGGDDAVNKYVNDNIQLPTTVKFSGIVMVSVDIEPTGDLTGVKVVQNNIQVLDDEIVRVMKTMPKWKPALKLGHPLKSTLYVMIKIDRK